MTTPARTPHPGECWVRKGTSRHARVTDAGWPPPQTHGGKRVLWFQWEDGREDENISEADFLDLFNPCPDHPARRAS
jgi:hypothetical protein